MQSDAKSAFCKKVTKMVAQGSILEAFGDHFGALLPKNGGSEGSRETDLKNRSATNPDTFRPGGVPINLNAIKAIKAERLEPFNLKGRKAP